MARKGHQHTWQDTEREEIVVCATCGLPAIRQPRRFHPEDEDMHNAERQFRNGSDGAFFTR